MTVHLFQTMKPSSWSYLGSLKKKCEAYEDLCIKQAETLLNPSTMRMEEEGKAYSKWLILSEIE